MMKNKKLISAILAAASIAGGVVGAQAADASTLEAKVDSYTSRVQQAEKDIKGLQTKVDALDTTGIADNKAGIEANKNAIATQGAQISQIQQDMAQDAMDRANEMGDLTAKVNQKADKADVEQNKNNIASNAAAIQTETQKREDAVKGLQDKLTVVNGQIENEKTTRENAVNDLQNQVTTQGSQISQIQQDMAQDAMDHAAEMDKLTTKVNQKADKGDVVQNKNDIASNAAAIQKETQKREDAVKGLQDKLTVVNGQIENEKTTRENAVNDLQNQVTTQGSQISQIQQDMAQDAMDHAAEMDKLTTKVNQKADKGDVVQNKNDIASNAAAIQKETQKREEAVKGLQDKLTITNGQLENEKTNRENADKTLRDNIEKETADRIAGDNALNSRINQVESDANKGIAKASALAALHPLDYDPDNKFDIAAAGGFYKGENAFALGAFYRPNRNVMLSMGTTLTSGDNAYNVGVTFKIGKSGKHTETGLTTADLYAMIGAMQDKMDQQQKKIEELEAKQAK